MHDVSRQALEAVDIAPWRLPRAEVGSELVGDGGQCFEPLLRGSALLHVFIHGDVLLAGRRGDP